MNETCAKLNDQEVVCPTCDSTVVLFMDDAEEDEILQVQIKPRDNADLKPLLSEIKEYDPKAYIYPIVRRIIANVDSEVISDLSEREDILSINANKAWKPR